MFTPKVEPALKASQPHQSMKRPMRALVGLPMGGGTSRSHLPRRGPSMMAATKAEAPPTFQNCNN